VASTLLLQHNYTITQQQVHMKTFSLRLFHYTLVSIDKKLKNFRAKWMNCSTVYCSGDTHAQPCKRRARCSLLRRRKSSHTLRL